MRIAALTAAAGGVAILGAVLHGGIFMAVVADGSPGGRVYVVNKLTGVVRLCDSRILDPARRRFAQLLADLAALETWERERDSSSPVLAVSAVLDAERVVGIKVSDKVFAEQADKRRKEIDRDLRWTLEVDLRRMAAGACVPAGDHGSW